MPRALHVGLIGGIGVAATLVYYQRLAAAMEAKERPLSLTLAHGDIHGLIRHNLADEREPQARIFAELIEQLAGAGCDCVAITSLGAHFCVEETAALSPLPIVSAIAPLDAHFAAAGHARVGLLGTRGVMRTGLYGKLRRTEAVAPEGRIDEIGQAYQEMAVAGVCSPAQRALFVEAGRRMIEEGGADAIALAGTDMNLAFDPVEPGYTVVDAVDPHVALLARLAAGEADLTDDMVA